MSEQLKTPAVAKETGGNGYKPQPTNKKWVYLLSLIHISEPTRPY